MFPHKVSQCCHSLTMSNFTFAYICFIWCMSNKMFKMWTHLSTNLFNSLQTSPLKPGTFLYTNKMFSSFAAGMSSALRTLVFSPNIILYILFSFCCHVCVTVVTGSEGFPYSSFWFLTQLWMKFRKKHKICFIVFFFFKSSEPSFKSNWQFSNKIWIT